MHAQHIPRNGSRVVYGVDLTEDHGKYAESFDVSAEGIAQGLAPGKYLVEQLPFLQVVPKWVPGFSWQTDFERWRAAVEDVKNKPFAYTRKAMVRSSLRRYIVTWRDNDNSSVILRKARGQGLDSLVAKTLSITDESEGEREDMAKGIGLVSYEGEHAVAH